MKQNMFLKIFAAVMFVAFAAVSCWSTTESLFLTMENAQIPKWVFWIATVGLFVLTSYCTKLVVDSLNPNIIVEGRKPKLVLGILGVVLFWLLFSMPTNTHTFFYKQMAKNTAVTELTTMQTQLMALTNQNTMIDYYETEWKDYKNNVTNALDNLENEIKSATEPGFGKKAEDFLRKIEKLLGLNYGDIRREKTTSTSDKEIKRVCEYYHNEVMKKLEGKKSDHDQMVARKLDNSNYINSRANDLLPKIEKNLKDLENNKLNKEEVLKQSREIIGKGIALLEKDEKLSPSRRLTDVIKVWGDYFGGKTKEIYGNNDSTLWYWILLSIIVDVAAFAFFVISFKEEN